MTTPYKKIYTWQTPDLIAQELIRTWGEEGFVWLDGDGTKLGRWVTLGIDPIEQICCYGLPNEENSKNPFKALRSLSPGHWTGWLSYEAGAWIEANNPWKKDVMATLWIASHDPIFKFDLIKKELWLEGINQKRFEKFADWLEKISTKSKDRTNKDVAGISITKWKWLTNQDDYFKKVNLIKELIGRGDIFQANLTACCTTTLPKGINALDLYLKLNKFCPAPYGGVVTGSGEAKGEAVISASPESFLKVLEGGEVETRPIKGTRPRNIHPKKDAEMAAHLICSEKDRAENVMIVDLLRNDLGKVCKPGSVQVPQLVGLESYTHVHHLTSVVKGLLNPEKNWVDLLEACWPGGSITGAPKLRACQRLYELEPTARGPYCGSLLHINWDGSFESNILIRSLMLKERRLRANAGCGIVADSHPKHETEELIWKLMPILEALR